MKGVIVKLTIAAAALVLLLWLFDEPSVPITNEQAEKTLPPVTVVFVTPQTLSTDVRATGVVKSRWQVAVTANVRGQVRDSFQHILPGDLVKQGDELARIDDVEYVATLADARSREAAAQLELQRIVNEQSVAKSVDRAEEVNDYRMFKPHVVAAQAALAAATANVAAALKQFQDTVVRAPFDAIVLSKHIVPAQQVNPGEVISVLASSKAIDITVNLSNEQWQRIAVNDGTSARVELKNGSVLKATTRYMSPSFDPQTRQRELVLTLEQGYKSKSSLLPEQQVDLVFSSRSTDDLVVAPATVLTRDNQVWTVQDNGLVLEQINLISETEQRVVFSFVKRSAASRHLVLYPLSTMVTGQSVRPEALNAEGESEL